MEKTRKDVIFLSIVIVLLIGFNLYTYISSKSTNDWLREDLDRATNELFNCLYERSNCIDGCAGLDYTTDCRYHYNYDTELYNSYLEQDYLCNTESGEYLFYFNKTYWCNENNRCGSYPELFPHIK